MTLDDLTKDVRRFLLDHWTVQEINEQLKNPEYFFDHVVAMRLAYLKTQGEHVPRIRLKTDPQGQVHVLLNS